MASRVRIAVGLLHERGRFLLGKRSEHQRFYPGKWDAVGGHVGAGESPVAALERELGEEIGVCPIRAEPLASFSCSNAGVDLEFYPYVVCTWRGDPEIFDLEHIELRWFTHAELASLDLAHPAYRDLLARFGSQAALAPTRGPKS